MLCGIESDGTWLTPSAATMWNPRTLHEDQKVPEKTLSTLLVAISGLSQFHRGVMRALRSHVTPVYALFIGSDHPSAFNNNVPNF